MRKLSRHYLLLTFSIMAACWGTCLICSLCGVYLTENAFLYIPYILGGLSPTIASYFALKRSGEVSGFAEWLKSVFDFRHKLASYLLIPIFAGLFFLYLCGISGYTPGAPLFALIFMVPMMLFLGGLEETGWRGILQPQLEEKLGYTAATVVVAVIWWLWHLPLFYIVGVNQYGSSFLAFGLDVFGLSFALAAIRKTTSSTFLCVLFHCVINSLHGIYILQENILGNGITAAVMILFSYIILWIQKKYNVFA